MDKTTKHIVLVIIGVLLLASMFISYSEYTRRERILEENRIKTNIWDGKMKCIEIAENKFNANWRILDENGDGLLPNNQAEAIQKVRNNDIEHCIQLWK